MLPKSSGIAILKVLLTPKAAFEIPVHLGLRRVASALGLCSVAQRLQLLLLLLAYISGR